MKTLIIAVSFICLSGCATILQSGPDRIRVNSEPPGAKVFLNDEQVGVTPMAVSVNHKDDCVIRIQKDGYDPFVLDRGKVYSGWFTGNLLLGGLVGGTVDLVTHNQGHYPEDPIFVNMSKRDGNSPEPASNKN